MQISLLLGQKILSMFLMACIGFYLTRSGRMNRADVDAITRLNCLVVCPCALINAFQMEYDSQKLMGLSAAFAAAFLVNGLFILLTRILKKPFHLKPSESCTIIYPNCLNLIIPIVSATLSSDMVFYCSAYVLVQTVLIWTHARQMISGEPGFNLRHMLNPNVIAILLGFALYMTRLTLPDIPAGTISGIGNMVGPVSMLIMGMLVGFMDLKAALLRPRLYVISFLRLIVLPLSVIPVLYMSGLMKIHPDAPNIFLVTIIAASSCSASSIPQLCQLYGDDADYAGMLSAFTLIGCIFTMPLVVLIYQLTLLS